LILNVLIGKSIHVRFGVILFQRRHGGRRKFNRRRSLPLYSEYSHNQDDSRDAGYHHTHDGTSLFPAKKISARPLQGSNLIVEPLNSRALFGERDLSGALHETLKYGGGSHGHHDGN
jgi:hypothetical protein